MIDNRGEIWEQTMEHLWITLVAMIIAIFLGTLMGVILTRVKKISGPVISVVGIFQTIPSLALLGFMIPVFGIGVVPAIIALFLYALLPIVRNTYTGILKVDDAVKEAAIGMGMTNLQLLRKVEIPLAIPIIFAGIRTAFVINVGVATLCALIAAGGLGEFIFRGISLNNVNMIFAGAIPAALLALFFDFILSKIQEKVHLWIKPILTGFGALFLLVLVFVTFGSSSDKELRAGFPSEFLHREDGFLGLSKVYDLDMETRELDAGLMYEAVKNNDLEVIGGYTTDGRIKAYGLKILTDDKNYFPPYFAAPIVRGATLRKYPELKKVFDLLADKISDEDMAQMNYEVDENKKSPKTVADGFLKSIGLKVQADRTGEADIIIGSKNFTESYVLAQMFATLIENYTNLTVSLKLGFGGTKLNLDALAGGDIDLYPEYSGTGLLVLIKPPSDVINSIIKDKDKVYNYVKDKSREDHDFEWLAPLGFNNTHALLMREDYATERGIENITDLSNYIKSLEK
ncbi:ABC transporter permease/substrate-binding protein [Fulvivirgaceae bacterium BMA12]|uniref:ABC transporter permease/substrate-binding protein n=1 Tax=Agaribacillus aureus TaxID=3051825 RepID=A0ABT8L2U3_9BACT|nr:ABC transporter permease/substrate-binding protein [Fulvivirgaceae bacterium BMA12]